MVGVGESYVPAFVLALGLGAVTAGFVATLPLLAGAALQLASPYAVRAFGSQRRWVVTCAVAQAVCLVPYVAGALRGQLSAAAVFVTAALYWAFSQSAGPAWNTWIEALVPRLVRARFFAARGRLGQAATLAGLLLGGFILQQGVERDRALAAFALAFSLAALARLISSRALFLQSDPPVPVVQRPVPVGRFATRLWSGQDGRLVLYMMAVQTAVNLAGPFFAPFMLLELRLSYAAYVGLVATAYAARIVALPFLGVWAKRYGSRPLLWLGGIGIIPMSLLWVFSSNYSYLVLIQALSGFVWGAYDLATQLSFFEMIRREERISVLTYYNLVNAAALVAGALAGGALLAAIGGRSGYLVIFGVSFGARLATVGLLRRVSRAPRLARLVMQILAERPDDALGRPVLQSIEELTSVPSPTTAGGRRRGA
jgi:MFS family permease